MNKPFNLELAKQGHPVVTRDGREVRILCFDRPTNYPIVAMAGGCVFFATECGSGMTASAGLLCANLDLFMAPRKVTMWVNVYDYEGNGRQFKTGIDMYETEERARKGASECHVGAFPVEIEL